jgi:hypothetical protein
MAWIEPVAAAAAAVDRHRRGGEALHRRQGGDQVGHVAGAGLLDLQFGQGLHWQRAFSGNALNARTGNFHALDRRVGALCHRRLHAQREATGADQAY